MGIEIVLTCQVSAEQTMERAGMKRERGGGTKRETVSHMFNTLVSLLKYSVHNNKNNLFIQQKCIV